MEQWTYLSQHGLGHYTVTHADNGVLACDCPTWVYAQQLHDCRHVRDVVEQQQWVVERRGDYLFVGAPLTVAPDFDILIAVGQEAMTMTTTATILDGMKASAMVDAKWSYLLTDGRTDAAKFDATFANGGWTMDEKLDGHRCLVRVAGTEVTTPLRSVTLPDHIVTVLRKLPDGVYDGELLVPGGVSTDVPNLACRTELIYAVFDLLECNGESTLRMTQVDRRTVLEMCLRFVPDQSAVLLVAQFDPTWAAVEAVWARGGEGVILKRKASLYKPGWRSPDWLKVKRLEQHTVTVTGFEAGSLGPTAVVLFKFDDGTVGRCKNLNAVELAASSTDPSAYVGRRLVVQCQQRMKGSRAPRHPMMLGYEADHLAGEGE
jgi:hypothetical protein